MYEYKAKFIRVVDGDNIILDIDLGFDMVLKNQNVRLWGIDAPESRTRDLEEKKFGMLTKEYLEEHLTEDVQIKSHKDVRGKFGRILAEVFLWNPAQEKWNRNINKELVSKNLAVEYKGQSKELIEESHLFNREVLYSKGVVERES
jgi:micrococcal nuclease